MIELNLLPDVKREFVRAQRLRRQIIALMIFISMVAGGIVVLIALYVYGAQTGINAILDANIKSKSDELSRVDDIDNYLTIQNQLAAIPDLHNDKLIYSRLFEYLPVLNPAAPNEIRISRLNVDKEANTITIVGNGRDYRAVTVFEDTLKNAQLTYSEQGGNDKQQTPFTKSVSVPEVGLSEDANGNRVVTFTTIIEVSEQVFNRNISSPQLSVPSRNTTESAQRVPQQVFGGSSQGGGQ